MLSKESIPHKRDNGTGKKKSLFAQQFSRFNAKRDFGQENVNSNVNIKRDIVVDRDDSEINTDASCVDFNVRPHSKKEASSGVSNGTSDKEIIHQENCLRLQEMSEEEILEEQNKLLSTLGNYLINYPERNISYVCIIAISTL